MSRARSVDRARVNFFFVEHQRAYDEVPGRRFNPHGDVAVPRDIDKCAAVAAAIFAFVYRHGRSPFVAKEPRAGVSQLRCELPLSALGAHERKQVRVNAT